ncbi:MAG TPA: gephyrin-like molybdotransferase Glp [Gemmataceae bacterium]|nr:gephyrin-like molybdotransferase Glp [Gemmataceae bacterium]
MRGFQDRTEVTDVVELLRSRLVPLPAETVDLHDAARRVLADDVRSEIPVPSFNRAAMDGYALRGSETFGATSYSPLELEVIGVVLPGKPFAGSLVAGQAVRIMTGAPLPQGADAVLQAEAAEEINGRVRITEAVPPGRHVGERGEDIEAESVVLRAGRVLRPQDLGVLASIGVGRVGVIRRPRVALIITGDELLPCGSRPEPYRIVDSNSVMLAALVERDGGIAEPARLIADRHDSVKGAIVDADADVVLVSGGSSVGQEDHAPRVVAEVGELCVHGVALRPASPTGLGFIKDRPVFLLPGNPVSCLCAYDLFAGVAVRRLGGRNLALPYRVQNMPLARKIASAVGRVDYVRVIVRERRIEPLAVSGASILSTTTRADGFVLVPRDSEGFAAGDNVQVYHYDEQIPGEAGA